METKRSVFCIVDASSFIFRAYYAIRQLNTSKGLPTNAIMGFANMVVKVLEDLSPNYLAIVYDTKFPSFRKELYPLYKANRSAMPEDLVPQIPFIKKFVECMGLPHFEKKGFEADDIIATLVEFSQKKKQDQFIYIVSSDKDLMQLVDNKTHLMDTMKNKVLGPKEVKEKMGLPPEKIKDYLGLVGDASDNIPGVKGIGPKSAAILLEKFHNIQGIYDNLETLPANKQRENLKNHRDNAFLSRELATLIYDVDLEYSWKSLECSPRAGTELMGLLEELELRALASRLEKWQPNKKSNGSQKDTAKDRPQYTCIQSTGELKKVFKELKNTTEIALDTETTHLHHKKAQLVGFSFSAGNNKAWYVPLIHETKEKQCHQGEAIKELKGFLRGKKLIGQNIKFDRNILRKYDVIIEEKDIAFDTMLASYVIDPSARHNMDSLALRYLNHKTIEYSDICGTGKKEITFDKVELDKATEYAAEDALVTWRLYEKLSPLLEKEKDLKKIFYTIELPLIPVLADMEWEGIAVDTGHLQKLSKQFTKELAQLEAHAHELAGEEFNLASSKQLQEILFTKLKLPSIKKNKTGFSTNVDVLSKLTHYHELPSVILSYREIAKLKNTYVDVIPGLAEETGRVHTSFNQTVAATGRLSSSNPNMQNIPIRTKIGKEIRKAFVAPEGSVLLGADYSQIELRVLASLSQDSVLIETFKNGEDIHLNTAAKIFQVSLKKVTEDQRRKAKAINFGILYGKTAFSLAEELGTTRAEATEIIEDYFEQYPTVEKFLASLVKNAQTKGYSQTLYGRKRTIQGIESKNKMVQNMANRMAVNTPIQGTAADLIKVAMTKLANILKSKKYKARLILQVHDELVLEVPKNEIEEITKLVQNQMEMVGTLPSFPKVQVPLTVSIGTGKNWLELK